MEKLLTTGQMIDQLKRGEVAENLEGYKVTYGRKGDLLLYNDNKDLEAEGDCKFSTNYEWIKNDKWKILRNYVSFNVAYQSLKTGNIVRFHGEDGIRYDIEDFEVAISDYGIGDYSLEDLVEGKWEVL